jgi:ribosomal protein L40E
VTSAATAIVAAGLALCAALAVAGGLTIGSSLILAAIIGVGALVVAVARKSTTGAVRPATCRRCGGLNSANAPYCKHCGAPDFLSGTDGAEHGDRPRDP